MSIKGLSGVFPVRKPKKITSSQFLEVIKNIFKKEVGNEASLIKMGHGGTIDRSAQGVLVVGINNGCSKLPCFLGGDKEYYTKCVFGRGTDTYNQEGKTTMTKSFRHITLDGITNALQSSFKGRILQKPPPYSALKLNGRRLSDLTREGVVVDTEPRPVDCYELEVIDFTPPALSLKLVCGRGFYVRSLIHDLGLMLGSCAFLQDLERTRQGPFYLSDCLSEDDLTVENIEKKIKQLEVVVEDYLDVHMEKYRAQSSQDQRVDPFRRRPSKNHHTQEFNRKRQLDQWEFRD